MSYDDKLIRNVSFEVSNISKYSTYEGMDTYYNNDATEVIIRFQINEESIIDSRIMEPTHINIAPDINHLEVYHRNGSIPFLLRLPCDIDMKYTESPHGRNSIIIFVKQYLMRKMP